jgi:superfamily I DNA/RNA helicase
MPRRSFYIKDSELDDYQVRIINKRTDNSFIVKGCAGSGKSILALWKAKQIQDEGRGSYQFIVFTKALMQYMSDGVQQVGIEANNVDYHWNWEKRRNCPSSDYIIVDEAQDFSKEDILLFQKNAKKALLLYGDSAQQLYKFIPGKTTISMEEIAVITGCQTEQLVFNHRLPKKVARLAQYISSTDDDLEGRCRNEGTENPKILQYTSLTAQLDVIAVIIKNRGFEDVGILFRNNDSVKRAYDYLTQKGLNVEAKYEDKANYRNGKMSLNFNSDNPKLLTYHSSKGLQFEAVFLPECTDSEERNPLYVAMTRTYQSLYIMHSGNLSNLFDSVPTYLYETSLTSNTTELL